MFFCKQRAETLISPEYQHTESMKKVITLFIVAVLLTGCFGTKELMVKVAPLGKEVPETVEQHMYVLPQTVLKVEVTWQEMKHVPGPFRDYAEKYLGITEVIRSSFSRWQIQDVKVTAHTEMDPGMVFHVNVLEGEFNRDVMEPLLEKGVIMDGSGLVHEEIRDPALGSAVIRDFVSYKDLGIQSNFEERTETMYKTIVTDTSFLQVPVSRTITEQKSAAMKAEEAADFLLELRTRRFELLTGESEGFPQGEAMRATIDKLDELEASYLTLFSGRTFGQTSKKAWFVVPGSGAESSRVRLGMFSEQLGFVPEELQEGNPLEVVIEPLGKTGSLEDYYSAKADNAGNNLFLYRLPDVVELKVNFGAVELARQRISVYQSGALIASPVR